MTDLKKQDRRRPLQIAVLGGREAPPDLLAEAETLGQLIARQGATLICGGRGGIMEAACRGAQAAGGLVIGILPESDNRAGNDHLSVAIATGLGVARNAVILHSADGAIAVGGRYGTLSEMAYARQLDVPLVSLRSWSFEVDLVQVETAADALNELWQLMGVQKQ